MNLTDIEKAVVELSLRHPSLTKEFLRTLLEASGWEEKHIKEAQIIYAAHISAASPRTAVATTSLVPSVSETDTRLPETVVSVNKESNSGDITFLRSDGTEEGELHVEEVENVEKREKKEEKVAHFVSEDIAEEKALTKVEQITPMEKTEGREDESSKVVPLEEELSKRVEEESLIKEIVPSRQEKQSNWSELPDNLPLVPFESAPHVWSLGRYKDTFYSESKVKEKKVETVTTTTAYVEEKKEVSAPVPVVTERPTPLVVSQPIPHKKEPEVEIDYEKTPISTGEESLVVLAGIMLLAIMLILGYMYGNGRL